MFVMHCAGMNCSQEREHDTNENMLALEIGGGFRYFTRSINGGY